MRIVSVGTNHAGTSFLRTLATLDKEKKFDIVTYDRNTNISFLGCGIALWVGGEFKDPKGLFYSNPEQLKNMGIDVKMSHDVIEINELEKYVVVKNLKTGKTFKDNYDKLVYAGGTWPIVPPFKGVELKNIFMSKLFQHAQAIYDKANDPSVKDVVVIGAGYIGIELVEAFHKKGKKVTLIDMQSRVVPNYFDAEFTIPLEKEMKKQGVELHLGERVQEFRGQNGEVTEVVTDKGVYKADMVIMAIGFRPQTKLIDGDKVANGAIKVDNHQKSLKHQDTYVLGDSAAMIHNGIGEYRHVALATNAVKTGLVAAFSIAGKELDFPGVTGTNGISIFGFNYASTGFSLAGAKLCNITACGEEFLETKDKLDFMHDANDISFKITYDPKTLKLLGAQVGSKGDVVHAEVMFAMSLAIQKKMTLHEIALMDVYFLPHYNKPFNFILQTILNAIGIKY